MFTVNQIEEILNILEYHFLFTISTNFGYELLGTQDVDFLNNLGVNIDDLKKTLPIYDQMYILGKLTSVLSDEQAKSLRYEDFLKYIKRGQYIPLTSREKIELDIAKRKTFVHLKGLKQKAKGEFESIILNQTLLRQKYEDTVKEKLIEGVEKRKSLSSIVSEMGHKMETWNHDWGRIVDTEMNNIFQEGRAQQFQEEDGEDVEVYKEVYPGACRHCIEKYLTKGVGSKPRVFKLSDLIANGTNIGRKVKDWLATLGGIHPWCRCHLKKVPKGYVWNEELGIFDIPKDFVRKVERKSKILIKVGDKDLFV